MTALLTETEAAERLRLAPRTLRELRSKGKITFVRLTPRNIAYRAEDVEEYVALCLQRQDEPRDPIAKGKKRSIRGPAVAGVVVPFSQRNKR
jgi:excisionase family DNA binding protein